MHSCIASDSEYIIFSERDRRSHDLPFLITREIRNASRQDATMQLHANRAAPAAKATDFLII